MGGAAVSGAVVSAATQLISTDPVDPSRIAQDTAVAAVDGTAAVVAPRAVPYAGPAIQAVQGIANHDMYAACRCH